MKNVPMNVLLVMVEIYAFYMLLEGMVPTASFTVVRTVSNTHVLEVMELSPTDVQQDLLVTNA